MNLKQKGLNALFFGTVAASSLLLVACGGGGGGDAGGSTSVSYTGVTTAASVDDTSAPVLADSVISTSSMDASSVTSFVGLSSAPGGASAVERLKGIVDVAKSLAAAAPAAENLAGAQVSGSETIQGCYGSSATFSGSFDDFYQDFYGLPIIYSMSISFNNYVEDFYGDGSTCGTETFNGSMSLSVSYDGPVTDAPELNGMTISLSNLSVSEGGLSQAFDGTLGMSLNTTTLESTFTMTANFRDIDGLVYRAQNYTVNFNSDDLVTSISGRLYDPLYGYIDIATTTLLSYGGCGIYPDMGVVTLSGYGSITLDANTGDCATYQVSWTSGDGSSTGSSLQNW